MSLMIRLLGSSSRVSRTTSKYVRGKRLEEPASQAREEDADPAVM